MTTTPAPAPSADGPTLAQGEEQQHEMKRGEAVKNLNVLHRILQTLEQEMTVFDSCYIPLDEVKRSLVEGEEKKVIGGELVKTSMQLASEFDKIRCLYSQGFSKEMSHADLYALQNVIAENVATTSKYCAYLACKLGATPHVVSMNNYEVVYDIVESDYPVVNEWLDVALNPCGYLNIIQDCASFRFEPHQKTMFKFAYSLLSRMEELLGCLVNSAATIDATLRTLQRHFLQPTSAEIPPADPQQALRVKSSLEEISRMQEHLLGGLPYHGSATHGEVLGLLALKCSIHSQIWLQTELHSHTCVLSKDGRKGMPLLSCFQSAGSITHVAHMCNRVRTQDLLIKVKDAVTVAGPQHNTEDHKNEEEGQGSNRELKA